MALFYLDEDIDVRLSPLLASLTHSVVTTRDAGRRRSGDEEQLVFAALLGRSLVNHNPGDYELLQRAWRNWSDVWSVEPRPVHAGFLVVPQRVTIPLSSIALELDAFVRSGTPLHNCFQEWVPFRGWMRYG